MNETEEEKKIREDAELQQSLQDSADELDQAQIELEAASDTVPRAEFDALREQVKASTKRFNKALNAIRKMKGSEPEPEPQLEIPALAPAAPAAPAAQRKPGMLDTILGGMVRKTK